MGDVLLEKIRPETSFYPGTKIYYLVFSSQEIRTMINKLISISLLIFSLSNSVFSQYNLTIEIGQLENSDGLIQLVLMDKNENVIREFSENIIGNTCILEVKDIPQGKYAFKYFHDENMNKELDTNKLGIPKEGFGFSNNARGLFGPPSFIDTIFEVSEDRKIKCKPSYLL